MGRAGVGKGGEGEGALWPYAGVGGCGDQASQAAMDRLVELGCWLMEQEETSRGAGPAESIWLGINQGS